MTVDSDTSTTDSATADSATADSATAHSATTGASAAPDVGAGHLVLDVRNADGTTDGTVELPRDLFDVAPNIALMHQVVVAQMAASRQGTHKTKTRAEVSGGGRKPYRQKGTGRARQGSTRAPQFAGGGVSHGPVPRDYSQRTPKKMIAAALRSALSDRARSERIHVVSELVEATTPSTKAARGFLHVLSQRRRFLVVLDRDDSAAWLSLRNLPAVHSVPADQLNTYDVLASDEVVFTRRALAAYVAGPAQSRRTAGADLVKRDATDDTEAQK